MSRMAVGKTYDSKTRKKDTSSDLFDDILSSSGPAPAHSATSSSSASSTASSSSSAPRRSPRKLNPHPVKEPKQEVVDPFAFDDSSPPGSSPPPLKGGRLSFRTEDRKRKAELISPPPMDSFDPEDDDSDDDSAASLSNSSSQGSVTERVKAVRLSAPKAAPTQLMPPPKSPPLRLPSLTKSQSLPAAAAPKAKPRKGGVYSWRNDDSDDDEDDDGPPSRPRPSPPVRQPPKVVIPAVAGTSTVHGRGAGVARPANNRPWATEAPLRSVKAAHQIHDYGEFAEHKGDVDYLMGSLSEGSSAEVRILSMVQLAKKSLNPAFRQFLRSKGLVPLFFGRLLPHVGASPALGLPASLVLYLLSRDRLGITADEPTLRLALALARSEPAAAADDAAFAKSKDRVWEILLQWSRTQLQSSPDFSFEITEENLSARFLATEALVYMTSRSQDLKQKEALLNLGILQFTAQALANAAADLSASNDSYEPLKLVERYLRILEHATMMVTTNQTFLVTYKNSIVINACGKLMKFFHAELALIMPTHESGAKEPPLNPEQKLLISALTSFIRLLCNIANNNELCCMRLGQAEDFLSLTLSLVTHVCPLRLPHSKVFDTQFLVLSLLINLVEHCNANRRLAIALRPPVLIGGASEELPTLQALTRLFAQHSGRASTVEAEVDRKLEDGAAAAVAMAGNRRQAEEAALAETVDAAMAEAGAHMEEGIMAAYLALFLGFLILQNEYVVPEIRQLLPDGKFAPMVKSMQQLSDFMELTESINKSGQLAIAKVIEVFEKFDQD